MNIVFDLGGVVFRWQPDVIIESFFDDRAMQDLVRTEIFEHPDWLELDRGTISLEAAIERGAGRTGLSVPDIERLLTAVPEYLFPMDPTIDLIRRLAETPNKLFVLSNMHLASIAHLEQEHDIWSLFDGVVISSRIKTIKPELRIYRYLLDTYRLAPAETVFIDDRPENLEAAASLGIRTIRFFDPVQCERALSEYQCF
ncbi:MAG: HAD family hydrolase [Gammaproteobacteria bacterium]